MAFVIGASKTKFGILRETLPQLAYKAIYDCLEDSRTGLEEIDAILVSNFLGGPAASQLHVNSLIASILPGWRKPALRVETACASGGVAFHQAVNSLGQYKNILVLGVEKMTDVRSPELSSGIALAGDAQIDQSQGLVFPAAYALIAQQHMLRYGTTLDDLSLVSLKNHSNANKNPLAHFYHKRVTLEEISSSPVVASPLRLFDCSPVSDGASAVLVSKEKRDDRSVKVLSSRIATDTISITQRKTLTSFEAAVNASREAFLEAKMTPRDMGLFQVHDCFTIAELIAMEDIGLSKPGESVKLLRSKQTELGGKHPVNPDGGLKASGHPIGCSGVAQVYEIVKQIRGEAGEHQVKGAKTGLAHNVGGVGGTVSISILSA